VIGAGTGGTPCRTRALPLDVLESDTDVVLGSDGNRRYAGLQPFSDVHVIPVSRPSARTLSEPARAREGIPRWISSP